MHPDIINFETFYSNQLEGEQMLPSGIADSYKLTACLYMTEDKSVFIITETATGKKFILKRVVKKHIRQCEMEREILKSLAHPFIPKVRSWFADEEYAYLIREYFEGITLDALITSGGSLPEFEALKLTGQVCDLLSYLHAQDPPVIHRDIKPQNIVLRPDGRIGLIDFDASRRFHAEASSDTVYMGTSKTAAPEQFGYKQTSKQTDIYSLGILLIFLTTGSYDRSDIPKMPPGIRSTAERCTEFDPGNRFSSVEQVKDSLLRKNPANRRKRAAILTSYIVMGLLLITLSALLIRSYTTPQKQDGPSSVTFENPAIEHAVRAALRKDADEPLTKSDLGRVGTLTMIGDLTGDLPAYETFQQDYYGHKLSLNGSPITRGTVDSFNDISKLPFLTELILVDQQLTSLDGIENLHLTKLYLAYNNITDLTPLKDMKSLKALSLTCNPVSDLTPLKDLTYLDYLQLCGTGVTDLSPLSSLQSLNCLDVSFMTGLDLSPVKNLKNLTKLFQ